MKNLDLNSMGVQEMNSQEMQETDGGLILIIFGVCAAVMALTAFCCHNIMMDPSAFDRNLEAPSLDLAERYNMPIGY